MFFFSSFFAGAPVLIMAFFYLLYFGAYALNKPRVIENESLPELKEVFVKDEEASLEENTFVYHRSILLNQVVASTLKPEAPLYKLLKISPHVISERKTCSHLFAFDLFSRPPPSLG